jgi:hypothetical protein
VREPNIGAFVNVLLPENVLVSPRSVEDAAVVTVLERVVPLNARPEPMRSVCTAPLPLPRRIPESVEEPVPPTLTERVEVAPSVLAEVKNGIWLAEPV